MTTTTWEMKEKKRWEFSIELTTKTNLHVGSGDTEYYPFDADINTKKFEFNAVIKGKSNLPIIPASTIKGKLYQWLNERTNDEDEELKEQIIQLFGKESIQGDQTKQGSGGKAEFHDAYICQPLIKDTSDNKTDLSNLPFWDETRQTSITASTAIDRNTKTALHQSLHHIEIVPPEVRFKLRITGFLTDEEATLLMGVLNSFKTPDQAPVFGAKDTDGNGKMELCGNINVSYLGTDEILDWLKSSSLPMATTALKPLSNTEIKTLANSKSYLSSVTKIKLDIALQFDGPFLVNHPISGEKGEVDHKPLRDIHHNPQLPTSSIRGALRSQAERIIRTMGGKCCDTENPCKTIYSLEEVEENLCLSCQIFGASGWKTLIHINDFRLKEIDNNSKTQEFVAIDRFHGGGKEGALFNTEHCERPLYKGSITLDPRIAGKEWGKGLLALTLKDLKEGDITFGFGSNKAYGNIETAIIDGEEKLTTDDNDTIQAFRDKSNQEAKTYSCISREQADGQVSTNTTDQQQHQLNNSGDFHNPYHFIPVSTPETSTWLEKEKIKDTNNQDSHAIYHTKTDDDQRIYHGRIHCKIETKSPIFIGAGLDNDENNSTGSKNIIEPYKLNSSTAIPATSLRGAISSLAEAASNSSLRVLHNEIMSYRKPATPGQALNKIGILIEGNDDKLQLLSAEHLVPGQKPIILKNAYSDEPMNSFIQANSSWSPKTNHIFYLDPDNIKTDSHGKTTTSIPPTSLSNIKMIPGILRILGKEGREDEIPVEKKHEWFIPIPKDVEDFNKYLESQNSALKIDPKAIHRFHQLSDQRTDSQKAKRNRGELEENEHLPFTPKGTTPERNESPNIRLSQGDIVYYDIDAQDTVTEISLSAIWRGRVEQGLKETPVSDFFDQELSPFNKKRTLISPAELLFGFVQNDKDKDMGQEAEDESRALSYKGKVRISAAILTPEINEEKCRDPLITLKILSSPKLPSPSLYFKQKDKNKKQYIKKHELNKIDHQPQGRKIYLHALRKGKEIQKLTKNGEIGKAGNLPYPWQTHPEHANEYLDQKVQIRPIKQNTSFEFHIDFDNLSEWELDLLCYTLSPDENFEHKIGMGKPIGLGSVSITANSIKLIDRNKRYSEDSYTQPRYHQSITSKSIAEYRNRYITTMNSNIHKAITLIGNPANITKPVHYPQVAGHDIEDKTYQWFVANDTGSGSKHNKLVAAEQSLATIETNTKSIPTLKRHPWNGE